MGLGSNAKSIFVYCALYLIKVCSIAIILPFNIPAFLKHLSSFTSPFVIFGHDSDTLTDFDQSVWKHFRFQKHIIVNPARKINVMIEC